MKKIITLLFFTSVFCNTTINAQQEGLIGEVKMFAGNFASRGWAFCEGQLLLISENQALFSLLGTMYGGDGRSTFALPDLRGRTAVGVGTGPGQPTIVQGQQFGAFNKTLSTQELPSHNHAANVTQDTNTVSITANTSAANAIRETPITGDVPAVANRPSGGLLPETIKSFAPATDTPIESQVFTITAPLPTVIIENTGDQQSFSIAQPSTAIRYIIATIGLFPSRG